MLNLVGSLLSSSVGYRAGFGGMRRGTILFLRLDLIAQMINASLGWSEPRFGHMLGSLQWKYFKELTEDAGDSPPPAYLEEIYK